MIIDFKQLNPETSLICNYAKLELTEAQFNGYLFYSPDFKFKWFVDLLNYEINRDQYLRTVKTFDIYLLFNSNFNWLIRLVEAIETDYPEWSFRIEFNSCHIVNKQGEKPPQFCYHKGDTKLEAVYHAVIYFLEWLKKAHPEKFFKR